MIHDILLNATIQLVDMLKQIFILLLSHLLLHLQFGPQVDPIPIFFRIEQYILTLVAIVDRKPQKSIYSFACEILK